MYKVLRLVSMVQTEDEISTGIRKSKHVIKKTDKIIIDTPSAKRTRFSTPGTLRSSKNNLRASIIKNISLNDGVV